MNTSLPSKDKKAGIPRPYNFDCFVDPAHHRTLDGKNVTEIALSAFETRLSILDDPSNSEWSDQKNKFINAIQAGQIHLSLYPFAKQKEFSLKSGTIEYGIIRLHETQEEQGKGKDYLQIKIPSTFYHHGQDKKLHPDQALVKMVKTMTGFLNKGKFNTPLDSHTRQAARKIDYLHPWHRLTTNIILSHKIKLPSPARKQKK